MTPFQIYYNLDVRIVLELLSLTFYIVLDVEFTYFLIY
jgi:hypothetical protein